MVGAGALARTVGPSRVEIFRQDGLSLGQHSALIGASLRLALTHQFLEFTFAVIRIRGGGASSVCVVGCLAATRGAAPASHKSVARDSMQTSE